MALWQKLRGGVARRSLVRANSNTILECTFPEENVNGACSGKTRRWTDTSD